MKKITTTDFSRDEKEILEEVMNIAFGSASAELGEVIDIHVSLNAPEVHVTDIQSVPDYFQSIREDNEGIKIIEQNFWGDFAGRSFLVVSVNTGNDLISLAEGTPPGDETMARTEIRHNGVLLEIGNILIGACIGKIGELLTTVVTYSPPFMADADKPFTDLIADFCEPAMRAIVIKTVFAFENKSTTGLLLTITKPASIAWMRHALMNFMESYE